MTSRVERSGRTNVGALPGRGWMPPFAYRVVSLVQPFGYWPSVIFQTNNESAARSVAGDDSNKRAERDDNGQWVPL